MSEGASTDSLAPRQDRADSWTSSLVSTGDDSIASSNSSSSTQQQHQQQRQSKSLQSFTIIQAEGRLLPPHDDYETGPNASIQYFSLPEEQDDLSNVNFVEKSARHSLIRSIKEEGNMDSPSLSEFSISAYDYSPIIPQKEGSNQCTSFSGANVLNDDLKREENRRTSASLPRRRLNSCTATLPAPQPGVGNIEKIEPPTPSSKSTKSKKKKNQQLPPPHETSVVEPDAKIVAAKKRPRAVTIANPPDSQAGNKSLRRQSSPPNLSMPRFQATYATLSPAITGRTYRKTPFDDQRPATALPRPVHSRDVLARPSTAITSAESNRVISPAALFKPLPPLPNLYESSSNTGSSKRPGFLSVQTSPRKANFSRPTTASPAARSFGLVAPYTNLSPTYRDYRSLKSRESFSSLLDNGKKGKDEGGNRSRSVSVSSSSTNRGGMSNENIGRAPGPPRYISFAIDQESFREICPIFELEGTLHQSLGSSSSSSSSTAGQQGSSNTISQRAGVMYRYLPIHTDQAYPFHHATLEPPPVLRRLLMDKYERYDFINKQSVLPIKNEGIYAVKGLSCRGEYGWRFEYRVVDRLNLVGKAIPGEKVSFAIDYLEGDSRIL